MFSNIVIARGNNYSVQQVQQRLRTDQLDDSSDEEEENELQDEDFIPTYVAAGELSDSDTDSDEDIPASSSTATLNTPSGSTVIITPLLLQTFLVS